MEIKLYGAIVDNNLQKILMRFAAKYKIVSQNRRNSLFKNIYKTNDLNSFFRYLCLLNEIHLDSLEKKSKKALQSSNIEHFKNSYYTLREEEGKKLPKKYGQRFGVKNFFGTKKVKSLVKKLGLNKAFRLKELFVAYNSNLLAFHFFKKFLLNLISNPKFLLNQQFFIMILLQRVLFLKNFVFLVATLNNNKIALCQL